MSGECRCHHLRFKNTCGISRRRMAVWSYGSGSCTLIDPTGESISSVEHRIGKGTSHGTFSSDGEQGFFANSISKNLAAVELERSRLRATILVPN